jgi:hypothetical protein
MLYAAYQPRLDILSQLSFTETNGGGCRLLVAVLSRYKVAFAVIGSFSWLIDVTDGYVVYIGAYLAFTHPCYASGGSLIHSNVQRHHVGHGSLPGYHVIILFVSSDTFAA